MERAFLSLGIILYTVSLQEYPEEQGFRGYCLLMKEPM